MDTLLNGAAEIANLFIHQIESNSIIEPFRWNSWITSFQL